ncbi:PASTA domain-containing protein [Actinacidiphila acidipaludis]|uniref:PASTA domain-containing protein n=1 Tax=Actinacidiphila acidipaludis TaxID=2873382 RepID=A0ABS7Q9A9_9ACTN|nr:PASTA domain-containing protein [Streptomyces acidipaludis]MBY8878597.1 PASTA domain-containing protein [Streptomyces acidipaludis]
MTTVNFPSHPDHRAGRRGPLPDTEIERTLIQAMDHYGRSTPAPSFDSGAIRRRTRRRRVTLALTASAAVLAAAAGLVATLDSSPSKPADVAAAPISHQGSLAPSASPTSGFAQPGASASDDPRKTVTVPDLIGMNQTTATHALAAAGLNVSVGAITEPYSPEAFRSEHPTHADLVGKNGLIAPGTITRTSPVAGTRAAPGDYVTILIVHE